MDTQGTGDAARRELAASFWYRGQLGYLLYPDAQRRAYEFVADWKRTHPESAQPLVLNCHRAMGKTYLLLVLCFERCLAVPGQRVLFGAPTLTQCEQIVEPNIQKILALCPEDLYPEKKGDSYIFRNPQWGPAALPSVFTLIGCREKAYNHRGKRSNMIVLDECRDIDNFSEVATSVFGPHFAKMEDPLYILSSTPPESSDHEWTRSYIPDAASAGRYFLCPASQNRDWTETDDRRMLEIFRDKAGADWLREMECVLVSNPEKLVVPEFLKAKATAVVSQIQRPSFYYPLVCADGGYVDFFAVLFGYIDFLAQKLVIERELLLRRKNTGEIASAIRKAEGEVFWEKKDLIWRFGDLTPRELADLAQLYSIYFQPAEKHDRDSHLAVMRHGIAQGKIVIHEGCVGLIHQLECGVRDERGNFERTETMGHLDAIAALSYLYRQAPWGSNPAPPSGYYIGSRFFPDADDNGFRPLEYVFEEDIGSIEPEPL